MTSIKRRGILFVLSSPSGAGKSSIAKRILADCDNIKMSVSATTREPRSAEIDGKDYYFYSQDKFHNMVEKGDFLEYAKVFLNYYGTPKVPVMDALKKGHDVFFDIDWQGAQTLMENAGDDLVKIFILPPSTSELEKRLRNRAQDSCEVVAQRMSKSADEMSHYAEYDWVIVNEDFEKSVTAVKAIIESERLKRTRQIGLRDFVQNLIKG